MRRSDFIAELMKDNEHIIVLDNGISKRNKKIKKVEQNEEGIIVQSVKRDKNIFLFVDTCTWLNHSAKGDFESFVKIADLHLQHDALLLVPEQLTIEWDRNKEAKIINSELNTFKDILNKTKSFRDNFVKDQQQIEHLTELIKETERFQKEHIEYVSHSIIEIIEEIMGMGMEIKTTDEIKVRAADLALQNHAPFHRKKNSIGDSLLFLSLVNFLKSNGSSAPTLYFVTDNKEDFSDPNHPTKLHPQLQNVAEENNIHLKYHLSLNNALNSIYEEVTDHEHVREYKQKFYDMLPKCPKCNKPITEDVRPWDGTGNEIFLNCQHCGYQESTGQYQHENIHNNYY